MPIPIRDNGLSLSDQVKALDELEADTYAKFNSVLNPFDPSIPFTEQMKSDPARMTKLAELQQEIAELKKFRMSLTSELLTANDAQKQAFWNSYSPGTTAQAIFEEFVKRMNTGQFKNTSDEAMLAAQADVLKIMAYPAGVELIMKINLNMEGRDLSIKEDEDYVCEMQSERPDFLSKQGHSDEHKHKIKQFKGHDFDELKKLYKHDKDKHKVGDVSELKGLNILVPKQDPSALYLNLAQDENGKVMLSVTPSYRALFHELCHAHRDLKGTNKRNFTIPDRFRALYSKSGEELWAINLGKSSEKTLSQQDGIPGRITHSGFVVHNTGTALSSNKDPDKALHSDKSMAEAFYHTRAMVGKNDFTGIQPFDPNDKTDTLTLAVEYAFEQEVKDFKADNSEFRFLVTGGKWEEPSLQGAVLQRSVFSGCDMNKANFTGCDISGGKFEQYGIGKSAVVMKVTDSDFSGAILKKFVTNGIAMEGCKFKGADLSDSKLVKTSFKDCNFDGANLQNIDFATKEIKFEGKNSFVGADLRGANLSGLDLSGLDFTGADLRGAKIDGTKFNGANLTGVKVDDPAVLFKASINDARVTNVGFSSDMHIAKMKAEQQNTNAKPEVDKVINSLIDALSDYHAAKIETVRDKNSNSRRNPIAFLSKPFVVDPEKKTDLVKHIVINLKATQTLASPQKEAELKRVIADIVKISVDLNKELHKGPRTSASKGNVDKILKQAQDMLATEQPSAKVSDKRKI